MNRKLRKLLSPILAAAVTASPLTFSGVKTARAQEQTIALGEYIELGRYNGAEILWRCVAFEKATRQSDGSLQIDSTQTSQTYQAVGNNTGDTGYLP